MRPPDLIIGPRDKPYMHRWHLIRWRGWQLALHKIWRSDDDRALHDHVGWNVSLILLGSYLEMTLKGIKRPVFPLVCRRAATPHRLILDGGPVWTLWLRGPPTRQWGFHCPKGWRHWKEFVAEPDYSKPGSTSSIGKGCD